MATCPSCGADVPEVARFCASCGAPLTAPRETRKTVTVLFCDWVASSELGDRLDAETLRAIQGAFFDEARRALERHGGTVEKYIGDAVMAVFGVPVAHEDDALRGARAAVELRDALGPLNDRLEAGHGVRLAVRTGVHTGEVIAADASRGQHFVTGEAVVVAKRLEEAGRAGDILIGDATYRLVRNAALAEPVEPRALEGKSAGLEAWRLLGIHTGAPRPARRHDSRLVDRRRELELLRQAYERAASGNAGHLFTLLGTAGVGKSRLTREALGSIEGSPTTLVGRCLPYGEGITYWPLVSVVRTAASIGRDVDPAGARAKLVELLADEPERELVAERVGAAVGLLEAPASREETFSAVRKLVAALARRSPTAIVFDDVHWAEPTFLDLVEHLAESIRDLPVLLVCLARPDLLDARPAWGGGRPNATTILLEPLREDESGQLVENLLAEGEPAPEVRELVAAAAEGNPLFVEEMVAMLIEEGTLRLDEGRWVVDDVSAMRIPPTIQALLTARLDRLSSDERIVLETAAVMGKSFTEQGLSALTDDPALEARLTSLVRKELIRPAREAGESAFRFRHILIQDVAYQGIPKARRSELHRLVADWLEREQQHRLGELREILGYHLEQAYAYRVELTAADSDAAGLARRAATHLAAAARRAVGRGDAVAAAKLLDRGVALLPEGDAARRRLLPDLGMVLRERGELRRAEEVLSAALAEATASGDEQVRAHALYERAFVRFLTDPPGKIEAALEEAERAIATLAELGDEVATSHAWRPLVYARGMQGRLAGIDELLERALAAAERVGDLHERGSILQVHATLLYLGPTPAREGIRRCEEIRGRLAGDARGEAALLKILGCFHALRGDFERARRGSVDAERVLEETGLVLTQARGRMYSGTIELLAGDPAAAERELIWGCKVVEQLGERWGLSTLAGYLARALFAQERFDDADRWIDVAEAAGHRGDLVTELVWRGTRAKVLARRGRLSPAETLAHETVELAAGTDLLDLHADSLFDLADVLHAVGDESGCETALATALGLYRAKGNIVSAGRVERQLTALRAGLVF